MRLITKILTALMFSTLANATMLDEQHPCYWPIVNALIKQAKEDDIIENIVIEKKEDTELFYDIRVQIYSHENPQLWPYHGYYLSEVLPSESGRTCRVKEIKFIEGHF